MRSEALVMALISLAHALSHFSQLLLPPLFPFIKDALGVSYAALGLLVALYYTLSGLFQPLAGFVVDRYGARAVLLGGVGCIVAGTFLMGVSASYAMLALGTALTGLGNSVFHPADFTILNGRVGAQRLGHAYSVHGVAGYLGFAVAPVFGVGIAAALGWQAALLAGAGVCGAVLLLLLANARHFEVRREAPQAAHVPLAQQASVLLTTPVLLCFLYFTVFAGGLIGLQSFGVAAMVEQHGVSAAFASSALTAYLVAAAAGILAGGFVATRFARHDLVAALGLGASAAALLAVALGIPGAALPAVLAVSGFAAGIAAPARDLIVRAATPPGASGRVFGFVYAGLDVGSFATPVLYGWVLDGGAPQGVFYLAAGFLAAAILTVLQLVPVRDPLAVKKA